MNCLNCPGDNNRDYPMCPTCETGFHFPNRADCHCSACEVARIQARIERQAQAEAAWREEGQYIYGWAFEAAA